MKPFPFKLSALKAVVAGLLGGAVARAAFLGVRVSPCLISVGTLTRSMGGLVGAARRMLGGKM